ncbi:G-protein coupled receptor 35-like [Chiloscyllium punctatum]|uniref:G-protein coupled receptor 35-like n=1 Tax=Chiloscyllium punctatum TaxID=137246 RepID=UPI003B63314D
MTYMNSTSEKGEEWSHQLVMLVFTLPTLCCGLVLNGVALSTICCKIKQQTKSVIYMTNLILSDFLLLLSLPFKIYAFHVGDQWPLKRWFCQLLESLCFVNTYVSVLLITMICVDRYVAIKHPFLSRATSSWKKTALICSAVWIVVGLASLHFYFSSHSQSCFYRLSPEVSRMEFIATLEILFLICMFLMMFCSLRIISNLKVRASKTHDEWAGKSGKIILSNLLTFLLCFTPYHTSLLLYSLAVNEFLQVRFETCEYLREVVHYCIYLANVNCCLDAVYYFYGIKELYQSRSQEMPNSSTQLGTCETTADLSLGPPLNTQSDVFEPSCSGILLHTSGSNQT